METTGNTPGTTAKAAKKSKTTVAEALVGECKKMDTLWDITQALSGDAVVVIWGLLFKLDLPKSKFRQAVEDAVR
jgi:hypothetical protein